MSKNKKDGKPTEKLYRLSHQTLGITAINFETKSLIGYVELIIHPMKTDLRRIKINCKQCRIYKVSINDKKAENFNYNDPTLEVCGGNFRQRALDFYENCHSAAVSSVDANKGNGEITIRIPTEIDPVVRDLKPLRVTIEFSLEKPKGGIQFVVPELEGTLASRGCHMFTYSYENSSRCWFPCIDTHSEPCTWKIEVTVDINMSAISCGDLIETVYTTDMKRKTYHYFLGIPTPAPSIGLAVGPFEILVDSHMHEVTHFCLPNLMPILKHSTSFLHEAFEFYEELLSSRYPYSCYKQVFVDQAYVEAQPFATMTIFSTNLLHSSGIIDQPLQSRLLMAYAVASQFFGCFILMQTWCDAWLVKGISSYLTRQFVKKAFGNNEYRHQISGDLKEVHEYERDVCPIYLDPVNVNDANSYFPIKHPHSVSPNYAEVLGKKAGLIMRMLEIRLGRELILQVFNKCLSLAANASQEKFSISSKAWGNMLLSTNSFQKIVSLVTGKDINTFLDQWVHQCGCARFSGNFIFNRKRNVVELELKQDMNAKGSTRYVGPLTVTIQELDGSFNHIFKIEENKTRFEITCHSKSRRNKKKKIPLMTGEEVDMDLNAMEADSPVLWLRCDPDMNILRQVTWEQPDYMWQYQLRYERDVVAQAEAIEALRKYPSATTRMALTDTIESDRCFYRIRMEAALCLSYVANHMIATWAGPPAMMTIFRKMFGSHSCPTIVRQNNFSNFQHYFVQKVIPLSMAKIRDAHGLCPSEILAFLLDLFKYNDNSKNKFSDCGYRAALIDALSSTLSPALAMMGIGGDGPSVDSLTPEARLVLDEIVRCINLEKLLPSYRYSVTVCCLKALRQMQKLGHIPNDASLFRSYAVYGNFTDVRIAALEALVDFVRVDQSEKELMWLLRNIVEKDPEPYIKHKLLEMLIANPPFTKADETFLASDTLVNRIWDLMCCESSHDPRLQCDLADFYHALFGRTRPSCLPKADAASLIRNSSISEIASNASNDNESLVKIECEVPMEIGEEVVLTETITEPDSMKRRADESLDIMQESLISGIDSTVVASPVASDTSSMMKFRVKDSPKEHEIQTDVKQEIFSPPPVVSEVQISTEPSQPSNLTSQPLNPVVSSLQFGENSQTNDSISRLSEDSSSGNETPPHASEPITSSLPTTFQSYMFSSLVKPEEGAKAKDDSQKTKSKKDKKKKKKKEKDKPHKHKHKHKHKHEKGDKEERKKSKKEKGKDSDDEGPKRFDPYAFDI